MSNLDITRAFQFVQAFGAGVSPHDYAQGALKGFDQHFPSPPPNKRGKDMLSLKNGDLDHIPNIDEPVSISELGPQGPYLLYMLSAHPELYAAATDGKDYEGHERQPTNRMLMNLPKACYNWLAKEVSAPVQDRFKDDYVALTDPEQWPGIAQEMRKAYPKVASLIGDTPLPLVADEQNFCHLLKAPHSAQRKTEDEDIHSTADIKDRLRLTLFIDNEKPEFAELMDRFDGNDKDVVEYMTNIVRLYSALPRIHNREDPKTFVNRATQAGAQPNICTKYNGFITVPHDVHDKECGLDFKTQTEVMIAIDSDAIKAKTIEIRSRERQSSGKEKKRLKQSRFEAYEEFLEQEGYHYTLASRDHSKKTGHALPPCAANKKLTEQLHDTLTQRRKIEAMAETLASFNSGGGMGHGAPLVDLSNPASFALRSSFDGKKARIRMAQQHASAEMKKHDEFKNNGIFKITHGELTQGDKSEVVTLTEKRPHHYYVADGSFTLNA